ncbi:hypothetical protein TNCV_454061 [Trichonephila clavipes]|nr:hypothetical protein TNCV_454061 [Trichonephila clavipes]
MLSSKCEELDTDSYSSQKSLVPISLIWACLTKQFLPGDREISIVTATTLNFLPKFRTLSARVVRSTFLLALIHSLHSSVNFTENLVVEVQSILYYLDCDIHFSYVRCHSGNLGNDRADQLAKEATCQNMNLLMSVPLCHWKHVAWERTVSSWNTEFLASPKALWTKRFFPTLSTA